MGIHFALGNGPELCGVQDKLLWIKYSQWVRSLKGDCLAGSVIGGSLGTFVR